MERHRLTTLFASVALMLSVTACGPSLVIENVDYSQPIESVLSIDGENQVHDQRYGIEFTISSVLEEEGNDSVDEVRLIRSSRGFYFLTAEGFNHVYVFESDESELKLKSKIHVSEEGIAQPALNQRGSHIEVVDRSSGDTIRVNEEGRI